MLKVSYCMFDMVVDHRSYAYSSLLRSKLIDYLTELHSPILIVKLTNISYSSTSDQMILPSGNQRHSIRDHMIPVTAMMIDVILTMIGVMITVNDVIITMTGVIPTTIAIGTFRVTTVRTDVISTTLTLTTERDLTTTGVSRTMALITTLLSMKEIPIGQGPTDTKTDMLTYQHQKLVRVLISLKLFQFCKKMHLGPMKFLIFLIIQTINKILPQKQLNVKNTNLV